MEEPVVKINTAQLSAEFTMPQFLATAKKLAAAYTKNPTDMLGAQLGEIMADMEFSLERTQK